MAPFLQLPDTVDAALTAIHQGGIGDALESATLDFKEDPDRVHLRKGPSYQPRGNSDARAIEVLIDEAICFANGTAGDGYIVFGVADKTPGPEAFTGTDRDPGYLTKKILDNTRPPLRVEAWETERFSTRIIVFRVPEGLTVYSRRNGAATHRVGSSCQPLEGETRRRLEHERTNPDYTARPTGLLPEDLDPDALGQARSYLSATRQATGHSGTPPHTAMDLLRVLDLVASDGSPKYAAEILFHRRTGDRPLARYFYRNSPLGQPTITDLRDPLILSARRLHELVRTHSDTEIARVDLGLGQEASVPTFPAQAVDEAITNALVHRDWALTEPVLVDHAALTLKVSSPGGLPPGVSRDRLLTTPSRPRNPSLMNAMRILGLVEHSSAGFDRMWLAMLTTGRPAPVVESDDYLVTVSFYAGNPDEQFIRAVNKVRIDVCPSLADDVTGVIIFRYLSDHSVLSAATAATLLQTPLTEARQMMAHHVSTGLIVTTDARPDEWTLSSGVRDLISDTLTVPPAVPTVQKWIEEHIASGEALTNRMIASATGADGREVTTTLRFLSASGVIRKDPDGPSRGSGVRWIAT